MIPAAPRIRPHATAAAVLLLAATLAAGCASGPEPRPVGPAPPEPRLPELPRVTGPLELRVSYPRDSAYVATRGPNFIFGSTGHGDARLWINGQEVDVEPNGGFLAFLPVPADSLYRLRATLNGQTRTLEVPIRIPEAPGPVGDSTRIVASTVQPAGAWVVRPGERIEVSFQGTAGGRAWLELPDGRVQLVDRGPAGGGATDFEVSPGRADDTAGGPPTLTTYGGYFTARRITSPDTTTPWPTLTGEPRPAPVSDSAGAAEAGGGEAGGDPAGRAGLAGDPAGAGGGTPSAGPHGAVLVLVASGDTAVHPLPLNLLLADPDRPRVGVGWDPDPPARNGDDRIIARPGPGGGPYHYTWRNGVEMELTGERNGIYRVRLAEDLDAWTPAGDIRLRPAGTPPPASRVATVRMDPQPSFIDIHVALDRRLPYLVQEGDSTVSLTVFGATSRVNFLQHGRVDPYIERGAWSQPTDRRFQLDVELAGPVWGWEVIWGEGDDLVLRLKRPPAIDPRHPLRGLTVGVDAGHGGADRFTMGPTGFTEADANLGIARALRDRLEDRGATVVMTRTADTTRSLVERTRLARERDVDLWISVHNNAFPDGVNPWENSGTSVYYNHPRAAALAWSVQEALLAELGLRDLGVGRADLHQARFAWAPAILTENAFMMIPEQEAFLRSVEGQERIAAAHVRGLERWLREVAEGR